MSERHTVSAIEQLCCERCNDPIHAHFDCPACDTRHAPSDCYGAISWAGGSIACQECETEFDIIDTSIHHNHGTITISEL